MQGRPESQAKRTKTEVKRIFMVKTHPNMIQAPRVDSGRIEHALGFHLPDLSEFEFRFTVLGKARSLKTSKRAFLVGGTARIVNSSASRKWQKHAAAILWTHWRSVFREPIPLHVPVNAKITTYLPTRQIVDASNLYQAVEDCMQAHTGRCKPTCEIHAGILSNDSQIEAHDGSRRRYDPGNPRTEITLTRFTQ